MRKLLWLTLGIALAWYGFTLVAEGETFAVYRLRDGLLVALVGALLFAWHTGPLSPPAFSGGERHWPLWGRILAGTAIVCGAAAAVLIALWGEQSWASYLAASLWGVGALLLLVGLFWPGRVEIYPAPAFRWSVDAAGNYVRYALDDPNPAAQPSAFLASGRNFTHFFLVLLLLLVGVLVRVWRLTTLPATCVELECALALRLVEGGWPQGFDAESLSLFALLTSAIYRYTGESIDSLRWAGVILGALTLPAIYWAARAYVRPVGALAALGVVALLPWAVWSSRQGSVWSAAPLIIALVLGMAGRALQRPSHRWWGMTGVMVALLLMQPLPLWGATLIWLIVLAAAAVWAQRMTPSQTQSGARRAWIDQAGLMVGCAVAFGLPLALPFWLATGRVPGGGLDATSSAFGPLSLIAGLLDGGGAALEYFVRQPLLPAWVAALALVGWAALWRGAKHPRAALVAVGALIYAAGLLWVVPAQVAAGMVAASAPPTVLALPIVSAAEAWLVLLPFLALAIGVAAEQWLVTFDRGWAILLPMRRVVVVATLALLLLAGRDTLAMIGQLGRMGTGMQNETEAAMGQYLARCLRGEAQAEPCGQQGAGAPTFFVPAAAINHPATRLLLGAALESGRVRSFDPSRDLLPSSTPTGDLYFLVSLENQPVIELLRQLYPNAMLAAQPSDRGGPTLFLVIQISLADVLAHQGLAGQYFTGAEVMGTPVETRMDGPLSFAWADNPPLDGPFTVLWQGSLLVPTAGAYHFTVDQSALSGPDAPVISLQLDGNLTLDTSLGLTEKTETLAQGAYQVTLRYRSSGTASDWALRWTPPGGAPDVLSRTQLYSPALPNIGLLGTYTAGSTWDGPLLAMRKDLVLGAPVDLPSPYSVAWTGKLAAGRVGEYFFAVTASGPVTLLIDGQETILHVPASDPASGPGYSQASIYLEQGWHTIDLRYAPGNVSDLRVLWQPPGSGPLLLASRYLLPTQAPITMSDLPLPPAPELMDARLGDDLFALTANLQPYQPVRNLPPANIPLLVSEPVWAVANGCGADQEQFASPRGIAVDAQNNRVYVADSENRRVVELALADGSYGTSYALPQFEEPVDVALEPGGTLLVLDATTQSITRLDRATGEAAALALGAAFYHPRGLAVDWAGNIIVADTGGARVVVLDATGMFLTQFGGLETGLGQGQPTDVLALGDQVWAIAADHGRLWQLESFGSVGITQRASTVNGPQLAGLPDGSGFFMSDPVRRTVLYFAPTGQLLAQLGYADRFANPMGVAATYTQDGFVHLVVGDSAACSLSLWRLRVR